MDVEAACSSALVDMDAMSSNSYMNRRTSENFKVCPLCNSEVRLFFINFNEKLLMCKNTECEYPFGHEELQYFKEDNDKCSENEVMSIREGTLGTYSYGGSTACWSEIDKMNQAVNNEDLPSFEQRVLDVKEYMTKEVPSKKSARDENIDKNVKEISNLTLALSNTNEKRNKILRNNKWIRNLTNLQRKSRAKLVKPLEMDLTHSNEMFGGGELTINIGPADNELSTIKIEIKNDNN